MRSVPSHRHGLIDYVIGLILISLPFVLGFATGGIAMYLSITLGALQIIVSALTDYEWGLLPFFPMPAHLGFDFAVGVLLVASPLAMDFPQRAWGPLLMLGLLEVFLAVTSETIPSHSRLADRMNSPRPRRWW
jgi:hypothetical protein